MDLRNSTAVLLVSIGLLAGCGGDDDKGSAASKCGDVPEANSGRGATDITFSGIASCEEAQEVVRTGLATYDCVSVEKLSDGERWRCTDGSKEVGFTSGS